MFLVWHVRTLASGPAGFEPKRQSRSSPGSQSHIHSHGLWHSAPASKTCKRSPFQQLAGRFKLKDPKSYHDKNDNPWEIQCLHDLHSNRGLARARAAGNPNNAHVRPWWGVPSSLFSTASFRCFRVHCKLSEWRGALCEMY